MIKSNVFYSILNILNLHVRYISLIILILKPLYYKLLYKYLVYGILLFGHELKLFFIKMSSIQINFI